MKIIDRKLEIFQMAAQLHNFTAAAAALGMSQPNVTRQLARLEKEFGTPLFERSSGKLELTPAGVALLAECGKLLAEGREVHRRVNNAAGNLKYFRLGGTMTAGAFVLPLLAEKFMTSHPEFHFDLRIGNTDQIAEELKLRQLELALVEGPFDRDYFLNSRLGSDELVPVAAPGVLPETFSLRDYLAQGGRLILRESGSGTRYYFDCFLREKQIPMPERAKIMEIDNFDAIRQLVSQKVGITVISPLAVETELTSGCLVRSRFAEGTIHRDFNFLYLPGEQLRFAEQFISFARSWVKRTDFALNS